MVCQLLVGQMDLVPSNTFFFPSFIIWSIYCLFLCHYISDDDKKACRNFLMRFGNILSNFVFLLYCVRMVFSLPNKTHPLCNCFLIKNTLMYTLDCSLHPLKCSYLFLTCAGAKNSGMSHRYLFLTALSKVPIIPEDESSFLKFIMLLCVLLHH